MIRSAPAPALAHRAPLPPRTGPRSPIAAAPRAVARALPGMLGALCLLLMVAVAPAAQAQTGRWQWPTPPPHQVVHAFDAPDHPYGPGHRGIDIAATAGEQVRAVEGGTVRFAGVVAGRGVVSVLHPDGLISTYEPVVAEVSEGQAIRAGEVLGALETVDATASHCTGQDCLHLGARQGGEYLDPLPLFGARGPSVLLPWPGPVDQGLGRGAGAAQQPGPEPRGAVAEPAAVAEPVAGPAAGAAPRPGGPPVAQWD